MSVTVTCLVCESQVRVGPPVEDGPACACETPRATLDGVRRATAEEVALAMTKGHTDAGGSIPVQVGESKFEIDSTGRVYVRRVEGGPLIRVREDRGPAQGRLAAIVRDEARARYESWLKTARRALREEDR